MIQGTPQSHRTIRSITSVGKKRSDDVHNYGLLENLYNSNNNSKTDLNSHSQHRIMGGIEKITADPYLSHPIETLQYSDHKSSAFSNRDYASHGKIIKSS